MTNSHPSIADELDLEKRRLECAKLRAEIEQAKLAWWKRPGYVGSMAPIALAAIGLISAQAAGFFDLQRDKLKVEIQRLTEQRNAIQQEIDDAYLRMKFASGRVSYALHIARTFGERAPDELASMESSLQQLPSEARATLDRIMADYQLVADLSMHAGSKSDEMHENLDMIPASAWAKELQPTIEGQFDTDRSVMLAPDGRLYDLDERKYYTEEQISQKSRN